MNPSRLRDCLIIADLSESDLARRLNRPEGEVRRWSMGHATVPATVAGWLERLVAFTERHPPPAPSRQEALNWAGSRVR